MADRWESVEQEDGTLLSRRDYERRQQPHWLYRLFDADGTLLYVGQTCDPVARFRNWFSRGEGLPRFRWFLSAVRVDWQQYPDWWAVISAEKLAIESERPVHNRYHQPTRVAA